MDPLHRPEKKLKVIGRHIMIDLPDLNAHMIEAKIDTGAFRTVIHCISTRLVSVNNQSFLEAIFNLDAEGERKVLFEKFFQKEFKSSFGELETRYCVRTTIVIGKKKIHSDVSLTNRSDMRFQVLIGRKTLRKKFLVDVSRKFA